MTGATVMVYVQHLLGIGHQMRTAAIIRAMRRRGLDVVCVSGGEAGGMPDLAGARLVQLPSARAADASFKRLVDEGGRQIDDAWRNRRRAALLQAYADIGPAVLLIETFPFGRWQFRFELVPLLEAARTDGVTVMASVRDILVQKRDPKRLDAIVDILRKGFDAVLVHGDEALVPFGETFAAAGRIADLIRYTGYVAPDFAAGDDGMAGEPEIIVAAGGGAVGGALLRTALAARPLTRFADTGWRLIAGPNMPAADRTALQPSPGVVIDSLRPDYRALLARAPVSVSQAGYNTVMDVLVTGAPAVLVPFSAGGETEQGLRARLLADRGRVELVPETGLDARTLATAIDCAAGAAPAALALNLDGADNTAGIVEARLHR